MTEDIKPEERAEPDALKTGDFVSWNASGSRARGENYKNCKRWTN